MRHPDLARLFNQRLAIKRVAQACGISTAAVASWKTVPPAHAETVARVLEVDAAAIPVTPSADARVAA